MAISAIAVELIWGWLTANVTLSGDWYAGVIWPIYVILPWASPLAFDITLDISGARELAVVVYAITAGFQRAYHITRGHNTVAADTFWGVWFYFLWRRYFYGVASHRRQVSHFKRFKYNSGLLPRRRRRSHNIISSEMKKRRFSRFEAALIYYYRRSMAKIFLAVMTILL